MKKGFTLLELIVVIIIIGILATLGFTQYTKVIEKGRTAEAKAILGQIRTAEEANMLENNAYTDLANLPVAAPSNCTGTTTHYFSYAATGNATAFTATATRCTGDTGKQPGVSSTYTVNLNQAGTWGGSAGYY